MTLSQTHINRMQPPNLFYRGSSMKGTFKPGDRLIIEKIPIKLIKKGDLIIFRVVNQDKEDFVVHRVVDKIPVGLVTRGDNILNIDKEIVVEKNIIGRVIQYDRKGKIHHSINGRLGRLKAKILNGRLHIIRITKFFLKKPYIMLRKSGIIVKFWRPEIEIFHFETENGRLIKYIHKNRTVAICWIDKNLWYVRRPYDLVIEPKPQRK